MFNRYCSCVGYIIEPADQHWLIAFVNEYATAAWAARGSVESYSGVAELGEVPPMATSLSFGSLAAVADKVYDVVVADSTENRAVALNHLIEPASPQVSVVLLDELSSVVISSSDSNTDLLALSCGLAMTELIEDVGEARMGTCEATKCDHIYIDRSPKGSRSYCSQQCQTRSRVARHRAKQRTIAAEAAVAEAA